MTSLGAGISLSKIALLMRVLTNSTLEPSGDVVSVPDWVVVRVSVQKSPS